jgi:hypothetical protein
VLGWIAALIWAIVEKLKVKEPINAWSAPIATATSAAQQDKPLGD